MPDTVRPSPVPPPGTPLTPRQITGVVLAGGRGTRMGGLDKGLQSLDGTPLALHALRRLQPQVGACCISANRHADDYAAFGVPVLPDPLSEFLPDVLPDFPGPLAGLLAAMRHSRTPYMASVPCDVPRFPTTLVQQLAHGLHAAGAVAAVAETASEPSTPSSTSTAAWRRQPTFCLLHISLADPLAHYLRGGGRKVDGWLREQGAVAVRITAAPGDFANANTLQDLQLLHLP